MEEPWRQGFGWGVIGNARDGAHETRGGGGGYRWQYMWGSLG